MSELRDLILSRWPVADRSGAGRACAELALALTRLGASVPDRAHAVAALWDRLRDRPPATVSFRLTAADEELTWTGKLSHAHLWSVADPFLYDAHLQTTGDALDAKVGVREVVVE